MMPFGMAKPQETEMSEHESKAMVERMREAARRTKAAQDEAAGLDSKAHLDLAPTDDAHVGKVASDDAKEKEHRKSPEEAATASAHIISTNVEPNVRPTEGAKAEKPAGDPRERRAAAKKKH
jgi:hypothetical protein